jgi:hypothetical protein
MSTQRWSWIWTGSTIWPMGLIKFVHSLTWVFAHKVHSYYEKLWLHRFSQDHLLTEKEMLATKATKTNLFIRQGNLTGNIASKCKLQMQSAIFPCDARKGWILSIVGLRGNTQRKDDRITTLKHDYNINEIIYK